MKISDQNKQTTDKYIEILQNRRYSRNTIKNYKTALKAINKHLADKKLHQDIIRNDIISFLATQNNYADTTFNARLSALRTFYNYLQDIGEIDRQPITMQMYKRLEWKEPKALSEMEKERFIELNEKNGRSMQALGVRLMLATGIRLSELANLDVKNDIEIRNNKAFVHIRKSKNKFPRIVPVFSNSLTQELIALKKLYFDIKAYPLPIQRYSYQYITNKYEKMYGYRITTHQLRYTFATERFEAGMDLNTIRMLMGHRTITMTLQYIADRIDIYNLIS